MNKSALARQYGCCWETIDRRLNPDKYKKERKRRIYKSILDEYKQIIDDKIENNNIPSTGIYFLLKTKYGYTGKYGIVRKYVSSKKENIINNLTIRFETIKGYQSQVDWKEDFKLTNKNGELFIINLFLMRLHYSKKFYARLTIDKKRDEVKTCIIESLEYFNGTPREIWFDNMATIMVKEGKHKKVHNEIKQLGSDIGFQPILCQSRRPKTKGTVENLAKLCERLLSYNNEFETLEDLVNIVNKFNEECGREKTQAHNKIVNEIFEDEKNI